MPSNLSIGDYIVSLRVKNSKGIWSNWVSKIITVKNLTFTTATFTNAGVTERFGPTQEQINRVYVGTILEGQVTSQNGIQIWTVPITGNYRIEAYGASGANTQNGGLGGKGAIMKGTFYLEKGTQLKILVGQKPDDTSDNLIFSGGGGGGTYVVKSDNTPLIISGGGAGGGGGFYEDRKDSKSGAGFLFGGTGGVAYASDSVKGGFGGGGAGNCNGGGYSANSGGGGSYIHPNAKNIATSDGKYNGSTTHNGTSIVNLNTWNSYDGKVIIYYISEN